MADRDAIGREVRYAIRAYPGATAVDAHVDLHQAWRWHFWPVNEHRAYAFRRRALDTRMKRAREAAGG